jgi:hypothetical protein
MKVFLLPELSSKEVIKDINSTDLYPRPLNSIGYNYYTVQTRTKFYDLLLAPENMGKRFYYVIEHLIRDVFNYDKNIDTIATQYFGEKVSDDFLQVWEIVLNFNLVMNKISTNNDTAENVFEKLKKYTNISIQKNKKYSHLFLLNEITLKTTELEINKKITKFIKNLENLEKNGHVVIKIKDSITALSLHLLYMLSMLFEDVYIYRPELSYISHGEKYIIARNFSGKTMKYNLHNEYLTLDINLPTEYLFAINIINRILMQEEYILVNTMRNYIESQNYFGEEYHANLARQKANSDKWIADHLMLSTKDYNELMKIKESELEKGVKNFDNIIDDRKKLYL